MTIEQTIQDLTAAILGLTEVLSNNSTAPVTEKQALVSKKAPKVTEVEVEVITPKTATKKAPKIEEVVAEEITPEILKARTLAFSEAKGRDAAVALLAEFKAARGSEVVPEKRTAYLARIDELLSA